jgi:large subunit ribosomal protein L30
MQERLARLLTSSDSSRSEDPSSLRLRILPPEAESSIRLIRIDQIRSNIGIKPKAKGTLRALGLRHLGQSNVLPDTCSTWGMVERVVELVKVRRYDSGISMSKYRTTRIEGTRFTLPSTAEVTVEVGQEYNSITWPTQFGPFQVLSLLRRVVSIEEVTTSLIFADRDDNTLKNFQELQKLTKSEANDLEVARIDDHRGTSVVWQRSMKSAFHFEAGFAAHRISKSEMLAALDMTGTLEVQTLSKDLATIALIEFR